MRTHMIARVLLVLFVLLLFGILESPDSTESGSGIQQAIWTLTYVVSILGLYVERRRAWPLIRNSWPIVALIGLIVVSSVWSDYHAISLKRALELVGTSASAYFIAVHFNLFEFLEGWVAATATAAVASLSLILAVPSRGVMQDAYAGAWQGIFVHKNSLGQAMAFGIVTILIVAFAKDRAQRRNRLLVGAALLCCVLLLGSASVTSYLIFAVLALAPLMFWMSQSVRARRALPWMIVFGIVAALCIGLNFDTFINLLGRDSSLTGRTDLWTSVMEAIGKRPLLGYGYGTFWLPDGTGSAYLSTLLDWTPYHAHNGVLELLLDVGFVGTGLFLFVLAFGLWRAWKFAWGQHDITRLWPLVAMIYFIAGNITEANIAKYNEMNWVIFLVAFLFVSQPLTAKAPSIRVNERLDTRPQRREAVLR